MNGIRRYLRLPLRGSVAREVDDELRFHLESRVADLVRDGVAPDEARRRAAAEFGDLDDARQTLTAIDSRLHDRRARAEWWRDVAQDARIALRSYARRPGFTVVALFTLSLGIGANSAIFSVTEAVLLRALPYRDADRLVHLWETQRNDPADRSEASYPDFLDLRAQREVFAAVEGYNETNVTVSRGATATRATGVRVTAGFLDMLGVRPTMGRGFRMDEDAPDGAPVAIVTHEFWRRELGSDSSIVGRPLRIDDAPVTVIGILPRGFHFAPAGQADLWLPLDGSAQRRSERFNHWVNVVARLQDGVTLETARIRGAAVMRRLATEYPQTNQGRGLAMVPLRDAVVGPVQPIILVLFGAVAIVLLIACANVASLVLARSIERGGEIAVRGALGASRGRLVRQLVTENVVLALAGGAIGILIASRAVTALLAFAPLSMLEQMPHLRDAGVNGAVLLYTLGLTGMAAVVFGLAPALAATRTSAASLIRGERAGAGRGRQRLRDALVVAEIACTLVLVVGAALMGRSLRELLQVDPGFVADNVATARVALSGPRYQPAQAQQRYFESVLAKVRTIPGVRAAGAVSQLPLNGGGTNTFRVEGQDEPLASSRPEATMRGVAGDYFTAMGIRTLEGRTLTARDDSTSPYAVVVSQSLAKRLFSDGHATGQRLRFYAFPESAWTIAGVVADVKTASLDAPAPFTIYYSHLQGAENRMTVVARGTGDEAGLVRALQSAARDVDPTMPVYGGASMREQIGRSPAVFARRYPLVLVTAFAIAALILAIVGVYGVIAYSVTQRRRELAVRVALGASGGDVVRMLLRRGLLLAALGIGIGIPAALVLARGLQALLFGVSATDATTYVLVAALLGAVAAVASYLPARRALAVDPAMTLRAE